MAAPVKPWKAEYAKSSRSHCRTCKDTIEKETLRLGKMVQSSQFDGFMPMWHHASCIMRSKNQIKSPDDVWAIESLRWEDQQKIRKYIEGAGLPSKTVPSKTEQVAMEYSVEVSKASRATCKCCSEKIMKGEIRISSKREGLKSLSWHHAKCFFISFSTIQPEGLAGWTNLSNSDQITVLSLTKGKSATSIKTDEEEDLKSSKQQGGTKRKNSASSDQNSKVVKIKDDVSVSKVEAGYAKDAETSKADLEKKREAQTNELWALKDDLKNHVSTKEMREMLEANALDSTGPEPELRDRCADGMLFGAPKSCPLCSGCVCYAGDMYRCRGFLSEWSKCSYSTAQPERVKGKWKLPDGTKNEYLCKWFKSQRTNKPARILPPSDESTGSQTVNGQSLIPKDGSLGALNVALGGFPKKYLEEFKRKIEGAGGQVHAKIKTDTNCFVVNEVREDAETRKARRMRIPIVREDYLVDCIKQQKKLPFDLYKIEDIGESSSKAMVKVKGRSAVHEASGLQDSGHILEDGTSIYNTTLNLSDLHSGINSYYILQIIEEDKGSDCYLFRKWGRVGNDKIGGIKLEELSKSAAIKEFKRLFLEKTGNPWEAWLDRPSFQKQPGKFFPLDIDYGVNKQPRKIRDDHNSKLAPAVAELMKLLFNIETYRAAMMEFEINLSEMPLGKLSKSNIQKGFEALTQVQNLLKNDAMDPSMKDSLIIDASNKFFTMIPSIHPHIIRDEDDFKSKVKMLEALQDIEIASKLVGFDGDSDDTLDEKYKKLRCQINPLPHDCNEYLLIEKYLLTTHAPTHTEWSLELEEVFSLERAGEFDKFAPYREKLGNRMLLWHGSRLTNFVGILSQGLRIAPPEAPSTGYMFGKGIYFADLVSKSAQYCYTDRNNPVGFMVLSEVALGKVHELKEAQYMDRPPRGKHSTKGLGKKVPQESAFVKWKDEVTVPCGKPVDSKVRTSGLMYNEYIVYDTAQVKMQFLLKVRFHYKR